MRNSPSRYGPSSAIATLLLLSGGSGVAAERPRHNIADLLLKVQDTSGAPPDAIGDLLLSGEHPTYAQPPAASKAEPAKAETPKPEARPPPVASPAADLSPTQPAAPPSAAAPAVTPATSPPLRSALGAAAPSPAQATPAPRPRDVISALLLGDGPDVRITGGVPRGPSTSTFRASAFPPPDPATLLLLQVELDGLTLTDGLGAFGMTDDPLIPVGEFTRLLEMDVDVSPADGRIEGRLGQARRSLLVDLGSGVARVGAADIPLGKDDVAVTPSEIYLRRSALERLLPLKLDVAPQALSMKVTTYELLPIQARLQRQARQQQASPNAGLAPSLRVNEPYHLFTPPSFDISLGTGIQNTNPKTPLRYDVRMGGDLLDAGLQAYVGSDESGRAASARVLLERRSLDGNLLGPLHARSVGVGDVFTPGLAIGPRSLGGRGVAISTVPLDQAYIFNRIDLRGELPLGDDVELYVNDVLRGTQTQATNGQYEFLNVPLTQGLNVVRIVTFGTRGQRSEVTRVINVTGGLLKPGQATLEFGAAQQDDPLFHVRRTDPLQLDRGVGETRVVANLNYGITQYLTLATGAALYHTRAGEQRELVTAGLRTSLAGYATQVDVADGGNGRMSASLGVAGKVLGANTVFRHAEYRGGLIDENNAEADLDRPLRQRTEVTVDQSFRFGPRVVPITLRALRDGYADGGTTLTGSAQASTAIAGFQVSQGLEYDRERRAGGANDDHLRGLLGISTYRNYQWQVRSSVDYDITPKFRARILNITADRDLTQNWALRFAVNQHLDQGGADLVAGSVTKTRFGDLAFTGEYDTGAKNFRVGLQMNFGLGYNPTTHNYEVTRQGPGSGGSLIFHAFTDTNGDGQFQPGEAPVPNVVLEGGNNIVRTNSQGIAYLSGFGSVATARLLVGLGELDNPDVKAPPTTIEFTPRPGGVTEVAYPIRPTSEVIVTLKLRRPDQEMVGLSATRLRLVGERGVVLEGATEFDGSANFQGVPAGTYRVELDPEQAQRLRMRLAAPLSVIVKPDGGATDVQGEVKFEPRVEGRDGAPN